MNQKQFLVNFIFLLFISGLGLSQEEIIPPPDVQFSSTAASGTPATTLKKLKLEPEKDSVKVKIEADGVIQFGVYIVENPPRLVMDILNVRNPLKTQVLAKPHPLLIRARTYEVSSTNSTNRNGRSFARILFDLNVPVVYRVETEKQKLELELLPISKRRAASSVAPSNPKPASPAFAGSKPPSTPQRNPLSENIQPSGIDPGLFFGPPPAEEYQLGPEDVIDIRVFGLDELNRTVRISGGGSITLPLIGVVQVQGISAAQLEQRLVKLLGDKYLKDPQVNIFITEFNSQKVSVLGAVRSPGAYALTGRRTVSQLIAEAGGLSDTAGKNLILFRQAPDGTGARLTIRLDELFVKGDPKWNIFLHGGDVISIPPEQQISVYVFGAVGSPGVHTVPVGDGVTMLKLIALCGGLKEEASKNIKIKRLDSSGKESVFEVNLGDILSGKKPDVLLQDRDTIIVNKRFF